MTETDMNERRTVTPTHTTPGGTRGVDIFFLYFVASLIAGLEMFALATGKDGAMFAATVGALSAIAGYQFGKRSVISSESEQHGVDIEKSKKDIFNLQEENQKRS